MPEGRCLMGQALLFGKITLLFTRVHCGPLTPPQALRFRMMKFFVRKQARVWYAPVHAALSSADKSKNLRVNLSGSVELVLSIIKRAK
eukprot:scaffold239614_cov16-Tisochrysis_lutea.AAC.1